MNRVEFFEKIRGECSSEREYVIEILKLRGFLFDESPNGLIISDNSSIDDKRELDALLMKYHLGYVRRKKVIIENTDCAELISTEFRANYWRNYEVGYTSWRGNWKYFKHREHGDRVSAMALEPFIARYIKALSACCVLTWCSCDGNHPLCQRLLIYMIGDASTLWHKLLYRKCLAPRFGLNFVFERNSALMYFLVEPEYLAYYNRYRANRYGAEEIPDTNEPKFSAYYKLNKAAEFLYTNRQALRKIKQAAMMDIPACRLRHRSLKNEVAKEFEAKASELLDRAMPNVSAAEIAPTC